nr:MAG TPA: hypothetical protein [Caudoviricetes sp.]
MEAIRRQLFHINLHLYLVVLTTLPVRIYIDVAFLTYIKI